MRALILAPHQDDEILGACALIGRLLRAGTTVCIAYLTNGDYRGREIAAVRYDESMAALDLLGVDKDNVFFLGYGDTGMRYEHSFLYRLYNMENDQELPSKTSAQTYHPGTGCTLHFLCTNCEAPYTRRNFVEDLNRLLALCRPDIIVLPSPCDLHGDHRACFLFLEEVLRGINNRLVLLTYVLHAGADELWPNRESARFVRPICLSKPAWDSRITLELFEPEYQKKLSCIGLFSSQAASPGGYLHAFAKREEWFIPMPVSLP